MKFPVPKTLAGAVSPMLLSNWIFGIGVIEYPIGRPRRIISAFWSLVNFAIFMGLVRMADLSGIAEFRESVVEANNYRINAYVCLVFVAISICLAQMRAKVVENTFLTLTSINDRLVILEIPKDYNLIFKAQIIQLGVIFPAIFVMMVLKSSYILSDIFPSDSSRIGFFLANCYFLMFSSVVDNTFSGSMRYFANRFQRLNAFLIELNSRGRSETIVPHSDDQFPRYSSVIREIHGNNSQSIRAAKKQWLFYAIKETRMIHRHLCKAATKMNRAYGVQVLVSLASNFNLITSGLYSCYIMASSWDGPIVGCAISEIIIIMWIAYHVMRVILIIDTCETISCEANRTARSVGELLDTAAHDDDIREEINIFSLQLLQKPLNFTASGFFPLDYSLIYRIIGSVTTYLIIMIQMQSIYEPENTNATPNSTMPMPTNGTD